MNNETIGLGAGSYPMAPEKNETNIEIHLTIKTTDIFPETWTYFDKVNYIQANVEEYISNGDIEIHEVEV